MTAPGEHLWNVTAMVAGPVTPDLMMEFLGDVIDREPGADLVGLGLVRYVVVGTDRVIVRMT